MRCTLFICLNIIALFMILSVPVTAAGPEPAAWKGLKQMMSAEEFKAAGLDHLNTEQLQRLDRWMLHFLAYDSQQVVQKDASIKKLQKVPQRRRIAGHFGGWSGYTIFRLDNGEVWQQRLSGHYAVSLENPEVELGRNLFGFYELRVVKTGRKIGVRRVK